MTNKDRFALPQNRYRACGNSNDLISFLDFLFVTPILFILVDKSFELNKRENAYRNFAKKEEKLKHTILVIEMRHSSRSVVLKTVYQCTKKGERKMYRIKRKAGFQFGCFIIITLFSMIDTVVFADDDIPESCTGTYEEIAYNAGEYRGEDLVTTAWEMISDCDRVEYFRTVILDDIERLTLPENASPFLVCRYAGYMNGAMKVINDIYEQCEDLCYEEGEIVGEIAAKVYCDLSLALGGIVLTDEFIRAPVQLCGLNYEFACDVTFMFTTFNYSNSIGSCEMYTFDPWEDTWDQWRNEQCGYNMIPPTP